MGNSTFLFFAYPLIDAVCIFLYDRGRMSFMVQELSKDNFQKEVLESDVPVLVDFWAPWCGPCRIQGPMIEHLAKEYADKPIKIASLNIDENPETAQAFNIFSIPTLMLFSKGSIRERLIGLQSKDTLVEKIEEHLKS